MDGLIEFVKKYVHRLWDIYEQLGIKEISIASDNLRYCLTNPEYIRELGRRQRLDVASKLWEIYIFGKIAYSLMKICKGVVKIEAEYLYFEWGTPMTHVAYRYRYGKDPSIKPTLSIVSPHSGKAYLMFFQFPLLSFNIDIYVMSTDGVDLGVDAKLRLTAGSSDQFRRYSEVRSIIERELSKRVLLAVVPYELPSVEIAELYERKEVTIVKEDQIEGYIRDHLQSDKIFEY